MRFSVSIHRLLLSLALLATLLPGPAAAVRLKEIAQVRGVRDNQLIGYGLVIGLQGTGDGSRSTFTHQSLAAMLAGHGIHVDPAEMRVKNVAAVMVTATLPAYSRTGSRLDVLVSSIGDAKSLQGGTLLMTPLQAPNGKVYAVAQGPVAVGGFIVESAGSTTQQNHPNVGRIPGGALVEKEVPFSLEGRETLELSLSRPDFTTAIRAAEAINATLGEDLARAVDAATIEVRIAEGWQGNVPELIATMEATELIPDNRSRVVLSERTGTVVMGTQVRISTAAIAHGNLTIQIQTGNEVSQPTAFSEGATTPLQNSTISTTIEGSSLMLVEGASIGEVVGALNALGVSPRDLIIILQALRAAGALEADIEVI